MGRRLPRRDDPVPRTRPADYERPPDGTEDRGRGPAAVRPGRRERPGPGAQTAGGRPRRGVRDDGADWCRPRREMGRPDQRRLLGVRRPDPHQHRRGAGLRLGAALPGAVHQQVLDQRPDRRRSRRRRVHPQRRPLRQHPQHRPEHDPAGVLSGRADRLGRDDHPRRGERRQGARRDAVQLGRIRRDLLTFLQNSVREPKLQYQDLKVKLYSAQRIKDRLVALIDEVGRDVFIASLRKSLEDIEAEARRRIAELPDGTFRVNFFSDSTLRENVLLKYPCAITVKGDELTIDWRGAAPQFLNRAFNATLGTAKCGLGQALLGFFWPDLPRGISVMNPMEVLTDEGSCINPGLDAPLGQSLQGAFKTFGVTQALFAKVQYSCPEKYGSVIAPWFNQINTFLFGGVTQHGEFVGNVCADLNGMGGGARAHRDGE